MKEALNCCRARVAQCRVGNRLVLFKEHPARPQQRCNMGQLSMGIIGLQVPNIQVRSETKLKISISMYQLNNVHTFSMGFHELPIAFPPVSPWIFRFAVQLGDLSCETQICRSGSENLGLVRLAVNLHPRHPEDLCQKIITTQWSW